MQDPDAERHRQQRRRPSRERIDERQVTAPVGGGEEREVERLERTRDDAQAN